ncbi:hypothetical protein K437DRAFT_257097 [Tilletiaria anomala UBC 951]|uniref:Uncharacterized protein n=1 Tax=Tilletiaria anomala (strain ATCC 24038 / CBS 436.72 / UBC 951) TaxID=1037660 RepID=A0A066VVV1_TILAU|nr:uncharacterized protein K437DRAFT_257097 [Tilletiaria anomala UBC 951]KDN44393.1 hypothetical protein K437DRAFT_257097 [Tilletiaria anomala UBC 951]
MHPALLILLACLITQIISWLGKERLLDFFHAGYVNIFHRSTVTKRAALRNEIYATKQELNKTSSQDEFAKWAKLRRKVDKSLNELEVINSSLASTRSSFSFLFKAAMFIFTTGVPFVITTYHRKTAVFYLPPSDWLGPLGWVLSLPSAPKGAVSATFWSAACKRVLALLEARFKDIFSPAQTAPATAASEAAQGIPLQFKADAPSNAGAEGKERGGSAAAAAGTATGSTSSSASVETAARRRKAKAEAGVGDE